MWKTQAANMTRYRDTGNAFDQDMVSLNNLIPGESFPVVDTYGTRPLDAPADTGLPFAVATIPSRHMSYILQTQSANLNTKASVASIALTMRTSQALVQSACTENDLYDLDHNNTFLTFPESGTVLNNLITYGEALDHVSDDDNMINILFFAEMPSSAPVQHSTLMIIGTTTPTDRSYVATISACIVDATWADVTLNATAADSFNKVNYVLDAYYDGGIPNANLIRMSTSWTSRVRAQMLSSPAGLTWLTYGEAPETLFALLLSNSDIQYLTYYGLVLSPDTNC